MLQLRYSPKPEYEPGLGKRKRFFLSHGNSFPHCLEPAIGKVSRAESMVPSSQRQVVVSSQSSATEMTT